MNGTTNPLSEGLTRDLKVWAVKQLGVNPTDTPAEVRKAFLRLLQRERWVPAEVVQHAYGQRLAPASSVAELPPLVREELENELRGEVESFAASFFSCPVPQRKHRWEDLKSRCGWLGPLAARLRHLQAGLEIDLDQVGGKDPWLSRLAAYVGALFVLPGQARAAHRQEILNRLEPAQAPAWREAVRRLQKRHAEVARLEPDLLNQLSLTEPPGRLAEKAARRIRQTVAIPIEAGANKKTSGWALFILIVVGSVVIRGLFSPRPATNYPSSFNPPPKINDDFLKRFKVPPETFFKPLDQKVLKDLQKPGFHNLDENTRKMLQEIWTRERSWRKEAGQGKPKPRAKPFSGSPSLAPGVSKEGGKSLPPLKYGP